MPSSRVNDAQQPSTNLAEPNKTDSRLIPPQMTPERTTSTHATSSSSIAPWGGWDSDSEGDMLEGGELTEPYYDSEEDVLESMECAAKEDFYWDGSLLGLTIDESRLRYAA